MEDLVEANELFERSRVIFRSLGRPNSVTVLQLGMTALQEGRFRTAQKLLQKSLTVFREAANKLGIVQALTGMARLGRMLGDYTEAESHLRESLSLTQEMDSKRWTAVVLEEVAQLANARQRFEISVTLFGKTNVLREEMGSVLSPCDKVEHEAALATARNALGDEVFNKNWLRGAMIVQDQFPDLSEPVTHIA
jgi:Flp pilus assembly protein TadD